jgi:hypothetical protein
MGAHRDEAVAARDSGHLGLLHGLARRRFVAHQAHAVRLETEQPQVRNNHRKAGESQRPAKPSSEDQVLYSI